MLIYKGNFNCIRTWGTKNGIEMKKPVLECPIQSTFYIQNKIFDRCMQKLHHNAKKN